MNLELSQEQEFLREAARNALARIDTVAAARGVLEGETAPDLWPTACEAGWSGLLIDESHGGAGLGAFEAMLVMAECGRRLANTGLLGHLPATALVNAAANADTDLLQALADGDKRAVYVPAEPPSDIQDQWTVDPEQGVRRASAPRVDSAGAVTGDVHWVPDAPGADVLVVVAVDDDGAPRAVLVQAGGSGVSVESVTRYDATRPLGQMSFDGAPGMPLDVDADAVASAWYLAQALLAGESLGTVEEALERSVVYAKERFTFGRAIGSYQAVKHGLVEILRRQENARSLTYYAGWAHADAPEEFPIAASAARVAAGKALDHASREHISVHGGIGATWEHDAPYFFRRAQLSRRLLGGAGDAADRVASELLSAAA